MRIACAAAFVLAPMFALSGCGDAPVEDTHGYVKIQFTRAASESENPFEGTQQVVLQMEYEECYQNFYTVNPNWQIDGEDGELVFGTEEDGGEGWRDRLCSEDVGGRAECEVAEFQQLLDGGSRLTVTYNLNGPLEARTLLFGPLPLADLAECEGGFAPRVRLNVGSTRGTGAMGAPAWDAVSVSDNGTAAPGGGGSLVVTAARP